MTPSRQHAEHAVEHDGGEEARDRRLERRLEYRTRALHLLQDVSLIAGEYGTWERTLRQTLARMCEFDGWILARVFRVGIDGGLQATGLRHVAGGGGSLARRATGRAVAAAESVERAREEGCSCWSRLPDDHELRDLVAASVAVPVLAQERVVAVLEFLSPRVVRDPDEVLAALDNIGIQLGQVWRRHELERHLADTALREQRRIGHELHDAIGQQLTGVGMMARSLQRWLGDAPEQARERAEELLETVQGAQAQVRSVIKGVAPVEVDAAGLMTALEELVQEYQRLHEVDCRFRCEERVPVEDNATATHLHRIAREALHNAVRHADAEQIEVALAEEDGTVTLTVEDDGQGFDHSASVPADGLGLHIMRHRARLIGAELQVGAGDDGDSTLVVCSFQKGGARPDGGLAAPHPREVRSA